MSKISAEKKAQYAAKSNANSEQLIAFANWVNNNVKV